MSTRFAADVAAAVHTCTCEPIAKQICGSCTWTGGDRHALKQNFRFIVAGHGNDASNAKT